MKLPQGKAESMKAYDESGESRVQKELWSPTTTTTSAPDPPVFRTERRPLPGLWWQKFKRGRG